MTIQRTEGNFFKNRKKILRINYSVSDLILRLSLYGIPKNPFLFDAMEGNPTREHLMIKRFFCWRIFTHMWFNFFLYYNNNSMKYVYALFLQLMNLFCMNACIQHIILDQSSYSRNRMKGLKLHQFIKMNLLRRSMKSVMHFIQPIIHI